MKLVRGKAWGQDEGAGSGLDCLFPLVKVVPLDSPSSVRQGWIGFLKGQIRVPADFDTMGAETIGRLFGGDVA